MCIWYVVNLIWTAIFELCHISSLCYYLCVQATKTPVFTFILLWLDFRRFRKMQLVSSWKLLGQTTLHLIFTLHWLPINARIKCKISSRYFSAITSTGPVYLSDLFKIYTSSRQLRSSADSCIQCIPSVNTKLYGEFFPLTLPQHSGTHFQKKSDSLSQPLMSWCLMSSDVIWHIRDKLWPMPKHGSIKATYVRCMRV